MTHWIRWLLVATLTVITAILPQTMAHGQQCRDINDIDWSSSGAEIAVACANGTLEVRDAHTLQVLQNVRIGTYLLDIEWSPDGTQIGAASYTPAKEAVIAIYKPDTGEVVHLIPPREPRKSVGLSPTQGFAVTWSPDAHYLAASVSIGEPPDLFQRIFIYDVSNRQVMHEFNLGRTPANTVRWSPDGTMLAAGMNAKGEVIVWETTSYQERFRLVSSSYDPEAIELNRMWSVSWSPNGKYLSTSGEVVEIWDMVTGQRIETHNFGYLVRVIRWDIAGSRLAIRVPKTEDLKTQAVIVIDPFSGEILETPFAAERLTEALAWSPDGRRIAIVTKDGLIQIVDSISAPTPVPTAATTFTPTPTSTPTLTLTPSLTPTLLAKFDKLRLSPACSPDPATLRVWVVRNLNPFDLPFTWEVQGNREQGSGVARANGETLFTTKTIHPTANVVRIFVQGKLQDASTSTSTQCPTPTPGG